METLYKSPNVAIVDELNEKNKKTLKTSIKYDGITIISNTVTDTSTGASSLVVTVKIGDDLEETLDEPPVTYKRYLVNKLLPDPVVVAWNNESTYNDVIASIAKLYAIPPFTYTTSSTDGHDFSVDDLSKEFALGDFTKGRYEFSLPFDNNSYGYFGNLNVMVVDEKDINIIFRTTTIDGLKYPDGGSGTKGSFSLLGNPVKFEIPSSAIPSIVEGNTTSTNLKDPLVKAIIDSIVKNYLFDGAEPSGLRSQLEEAVVNSIITNIYIPDGDVIESFTLIINETNSYWSGSLILTPITWTD